MSCVHTQMLCGAHSSIQEDRLAVRLPWRADSGSLFDCAVTGSLDL